MLKLIEKSMKKEELDAEREIKDLRRFFYFGEEINNYYKWRK
jgi:hypothetical protein